jgi:hypothetical protein
VSDWVLATLTGFWGFCRSPQVDGVTEPLVHYSHFFPILSNSSTVHSSHVIRYEVLILIHHKRSSYKMQETAQNRKILKIQFLEQSVELWWVKDQQMHHSFNVLVFNILLHCICSSGYFLGVILWFADVSEPSVGRIFKGGLYSMKYTSYCTTSLWRWGRQKVSKRRKTTIWRRGNTQKNTYNIQNTAKVWNQEYCYMFRHFKMPSSGSPIWTCWDGTQSREQLKQVEILLKR